MTEKWKELLSLVPQAPDYIIDWNALEQSNLHSFIQKMKMTEQNPVWHAEGDVWTHTRMVCEEMVRLPAFLHAEKRIQEILFLASLFHDFGKIPATKWEDGAWTSPNHTSASAGMARKIMWKIYGFCGTKELQAFRETICTLVRYHSVPPHILDQKNPERRLLKIASNGELLADFTLELLCILVEADIRGRIYPHKQESLEVIDIFRETAKNLGCYEGPAVFASDFSKYVFFSGKKILPDQELFDDTWGEVILLSGLPGTGKDTFIKTHYGNLPVVSLDELRKEMHISPKENSGPVIHAGKERAKAYLRRKQPFIWNATNRTPKVREKIIQLITSYHASVKIVFLETEWEEELRRNKNRTAIVPEDVIENMLRGFVPPERFEAHKVEWHCT